MLKESTLQHKLQFIYKLIAGVAIFCLIVFLLNSLLSFCNLERYDKLFNPKSSYPIFISGDGDLSENYVLNPHFEYALNYQTFPKKKALGTTRIFIVGSSAANGYPFKEEDGFSGYLRRSLDRFAPGKFEVINAAGMSYGSHRVFDVLQDVILLDPDLVIVYAGNNEYVERNVIAGITKKGGPIFDKIGGVLGRTNLYRAVRLILYRVSPAVFQQSMKNDLTDMRAGNFINRGGLVRTTSVDLEVLNNYKNNISAMRDLLATAGVKGIFCTVPSNVADWHPEMTLPKLANQEQAANWNKLQADVANNLDAQNNTGRDSSGENALLLQEIDLLSRMLQIVPDHPMTHFVLGDALMRLGEYDRAYKEFVQAKDLDAVPIRELTSFNDALRTLITDKGNKSEFALVDLEEVLGSEVRRGAPNGIFLDYCHLTEEAHKFVAIFMLPTIQKMTGQNLSLEKMSQWISLDTWASRNKDKSTQATVSFAQGITQMHNGLYSEAEASLQQVLKTYPESSGPFVGGVFASLSRIYLAQGNHIRYREVLLKGLEAYPENQIILISLGLLYVEEGNELDRAAEFFRKAIRLNSYAPKAYEGLGLLAMHNGSAQEAIDHFQEASRLVDGGDPTLQKNLGKAYFASGDEKSAVIAWKTAFALNSSDMEVQELLKKHTRHH